YGDLAAAAPVVVYSCLPVSTSIQLNDDGGIAKFNTDKDVYWHQMERNELAAMVTCDVTRRSLEKRMNAIASMLRGIPGMAGTANRYDFDGINYKSILQDAMRTISFSSSRPEFLAGLVDVEARLVGNAVAAGLKMAQFRKTSLSRPAEALQRLAEFGED